MKKLLLIIALGLSVLSATVFAEYNNQVDSKNGDLMCPSDQRMVGIHERCNPSGCVIDYLHCQ